ncbi:MAG TPA: hypothetical protein VKA21_04445, partial [Candidatus Binatia bacterium]|nr:hypothetical protein [Candidatus Binatia bacterium]
HDLVAAALAAVGDAGGTPHGARVDFAPPLADANRCTHGLIVPVAVRGGARPRPGKAVLVAIGRPAGRGRDVDKLKLVCVP